MDPHTIRIFESRLRPLVLACYDRVAHLLDDPRVDVELRQAQQAYWQLVSAANAHRSATLRGGEVPVAAFASAAGLFMLVVMGEGAQPDDQQLETAAGMELYILSLTLFDAIEDEELEGPLTELGSAVATNAAGAMLVRSLETILALGDRSGPCPIALRRLLITRTLEAASAQHRDLRCTYPQSLEHAVRQAQHKTSAISLTAELAALSMGCDADRAERYRSVGQHSALIRQCSNDLRDLFGKRESDDLRAGRWTLPLVALWEHANAEQRAEFQRLRAELPGSTAAIRELLFRSGAIQRFAEVMERARRELHADLAALGQEDGPLSLLADLADRATARLYTRRAA